MVNIKKKHIDLKPKPLRNDWKYRTKLTDTFLTHTKKFGMIFTENYRKHKKHETTVHIYYNLSKFFCLHWPLKVYEMIEIIYMLKIGSIWL